MEFSDYWIAMVTASTFIKGFPDGIAMKKYTQDEINARITSLVHFVIT